MSDERLHKLRRRADRWRVALIAAVVFTQTAAILFLSLAVVKINDRAASNRDILDDVARATGILVDCTTPGHPCYDRGQRGQAEAVANINRVVILAAYCAKLPRNSGVPQIEACVLKGIK